MSDFRIDKITNRVGDAGTQIAGISTFSGTSGMQLPVGATEYRGGRGRGVFVGGYVTPSYANQMSFVEIATTGNSIDFGDLPFNKGGIPTCASSTRGITAGGGPTGPSNGSSPSGYIGSMYYSIISSQGGVSDFGDLKNARGWGSGCNSPTRGCFAGSEPGTSSAANVIEFITMATTGDATNFGNLTRARQVDGSTSSQTRGIWAGGWYSPDVNVNIIDYITFTSTGDAQHFGELGLSIYGNSMFGSNTRGISSGGDPGPAADINTMLYITIATLGNAQDFGDAQVATKYRGSSSTSTKGVVGGGYVSPAPTNTIDYVTIATLGNATDFGDLVSANSSMGGAGWCDSNGGLE